MSDDRDELIDAVSDELEAARLWHELVDALTELPCKYPDLRDAMIDWLRSRVIQR